MKKKTKKPPPKQLSAWLDQNMDGDWCIECDDPSLTFDGHLMCIFPRNSKETDADGSYHRAKAVLEYMQGKGQVKR